MRGNYYGMTYNSKHEAIFESHEKEEFKEKQKIWWCTTILCTLFPFFAQCVSLLFHHKFNMIDMINNGDVILLTYSITVPTLIELIQVKNNRTSKYVIYVCVTFMILLSDLVFYASMKDPGTYLNSDKELVEYDNFAINLFITIIVIAVSWVFSQKLMRFIFISNVESRQQKDENAKKAEDNEKGSEINE